MPKKRNSHFFLYIARLRRRLLRHYHLTRLALLLPLVVVLLALAFTALHPLFNIVSDLFFGPVNVISAIVPNKEALKSTDGRTNILILGIGGQAHDGPDLSDTMIVASLPSPDKISTTSAITLISIPRDIYLDSLQGKINYAYALGQEKDTSKSAGLTLSKGAAGFVTGLPIHYGLRVDFSAFKKIVDLLGGVDINVEQVLDDNYYPIAGKEDNNCSFDAVTTTARLATASAEPSFAFPCRFQHLYFPIGLAHLDGETALKFVRSRHAEGEEGTDFARARRQQQLIQAVKAKIFSTDTLLHPEKIEKIYNVVKANIDTDLDPTEVGTFLNLALKYRQLPFKTLVLDMNFFYNPPIDSRGWILLPKDSTFDEIHQSIKSQLH